MAHKPKTAALANGAEIIRDTVDPKTQDMMFATPATMPRRHRRTRDTSKKGSNETARLSIKRRHKGASDVPPDPTSMPSDTSGKLVTGKLGVIAVTVEMPGGATINELTGMTGWQPHTVRAALTRLRQRGIDGKLTTVGDRKVYRVAKNVA